MRTCTVCSTEKPETEFYSKAPGRLSSSCKTCHNKKTKEWKALNVEKVRAYVRASCKKAYEANPEKYREKSRAARLKDPEKKRLACLKSYKKKQENIDDAERARRRRNAERWRAQNIDKCRASSQKFRKNNPHKNNEKEARRRASKVRATPFWLTFWEIAQIQEMYDLSIAISTQTGILHHVDHIIPLRGKNATGLHVPWNLRIIPADENRRKSNKLMEV